MTNGEDIPEPISPIDAALDPTMDPVINASLSPNDSDPVPDDGTTDNSSILTAEAEPEKGDIAHTFHLDPDKESRETFIPLRHTDLILRIEAEFKLKGEDSENFRDLCKRLHSIFNAEHHVALAELEEMYAPLDPDSELVELERIAPEDIAARTEQLVDKLSNLLYSAHYQRLDHDELERAIQLASQWGVKLDVNFEYFDQLEIFARGYQLVDVKRRRWQKMYREEKIRLPEFHRLILCFRLKESDKQTIGMEPEFVYLKIFKNIPETDLEILLPGTKVKLSAVDRGKILLPTISGVAINIYKWIRILAVISIATLAGVWAWVMVVGAFLGYLVKSVLAYYRTKDKYQFDLTRSLYLKNLDNNSGVLYRILNEAQQQELCETIIGFAMLWKAAPKEGIEEQALDEVAEKFLLDQTQIDVDFDLHDALGKLARLGLADVDSDGRWHATPIKDAPNILSENWTRIFRSRNTK